MRVLNGVWLSVGLLGAALCLALLAATFARGPALELAFRTLISQQVSKQVGHAVDALDATGLRQLSQWYGCFAAIQQDESARYPLRLSRISSCEAESRSV